MWRSKVVLSDPDNTTEQLIMSYSLWVIHYELLIMSYSLWVAPYELLIMSCSLWVAHYELLIHYEHIYGWATHRLAELLVLNMRCSLWVTHTWVARYELHIHNEHMGEQLIEQLSYSRSKCVAHYEFESLTQIKLRCEHILIGAMRLVLTLSKRAPSPRGLVYGTSLPVFSKTVQSKLQ